MTKLYNLAMRKQASTVLLVLLLACPFTPTACAASAQTPPHTAAADTVLRPADLDSIIPASVFFSGQSATVQKRNSGGVRLTSGALIFITKVDTGGYSSSIQEKYQDYLITETAITIAGHKLAPGAYGVGFIANNKLIIMDIGGHELFTGDSQRDDALSRPSPLQVLADKSPGSYRLYSGRTFVVFRPAV
jgi:hypothetical protein